MGSARGNRGPKNRASRGNQVSKGCAARISAERISVGRRQAGPGNKLRVRPVSAMADRGPAANATADRGPVINATAKLTSLEGVAAAGVGGSATGGRERAVNATAARVVRGEACSGRRRLSRTPLWQTRCAGPGC